MQHINKFGFAALAFFMGVALPSVAQQEVEVEEDVEMAAPQKRKAKPIKKYPTIEVRGRVVDAATGEPLAGALIQAFNNKRYTAMTGEDGTYVINVPKFITSLVINLEGYNSNITSINGRTTDVDASLYSDIYLKDYTNDASAAKKVSADNFDHSTALTIDQEIQKNLGADVRSIQRSANPAQGVSMFLNGYNSLNINSQPLIILDGVVYDQLYDTQMFHSGYFNNLLQAINMDDIESVEVLKNGTAIYGAKAANGVIVIKTKRCRSMATRIDVNISAGVELTPKTLDVMDAGEYRSYASELLGTTDTKLLDFKFLNTDPSYYYYNMYHNNTDWKDEVYREAWSQNYGISIQGGDEVAEYNLSVGYTDAKSTLKANDLQRFNIRFNTDIKLNDFWSTAFDASYTNVTRDLRDDGLNSDFNLSMLSSPSFLAYAKSPFLTPYDFATDGTQSSFIADADDYLYEVLGNKVSVANPVGILENAEGKNKNHTDCTMINLNVAPKWKPSDNFYVTERFSYTMQSFSEEYYTPIKGMPTYNNPSMEATIDNARYSLYSKHNAIFSDTRADWNILTDGDHRVNVFGGVRFMNDSYTSSREMGYNTGNDKTPNASMSLTSKDIDGDDLSWMSLAYYANADYNYQGRFYANGQLSVETSSRFGKDVDAGLKMFGVAWGLFPSIQGAWVISNEKWFQPNKGVNMLKVNAGFESVGNDAIDNSATLTYLSASSLFGNETTSLGLGNIGNSSLRWETTNRFNVGVEGNFVNNRLNVKFNYFYGKTSNLVTLGTLAYVAGLTDYYTNDGAMKNQGFDVALNGKVVDNKNFKMELGASAGHFKNELTQLPQGTTSFESSMYGATILSEVGRSAGVFYGYKTNGVYATAQEAAADGKYILDNTGNKNYFGAGDMNFVDVDGNGEINDNDRMVIGDPNPDVYGNIHMNFFIGKRWSIGANFNYSLGGDIYNYQRALLESGSMFINQTTALNRRWTAEGQVTDIPKATYGDPMGNSRFSDRWIEDGSYMKLKNVSVSYKIPVQNEYIQGITVWASGCNLFTLTKYLGSDPEVSCGNSVLTQGIDAGYLSNGRSFHLGVKINL
ncbi:MAG: SusC/RagA family TonB-linked outer membrane protein [Bacteroidaceae bacterium]|nr:SusC/RagA family TonB-linked outer membrane protein [Bacteroidaceae bacterium]